MAERKAHNVNDKERTKDIKIEENVDFSSMFLSDHVLSGLHAAGFLRPSPIQLAAIPLGRCGLDLVVQAKSGTGKTCVFVVAALEMISVTASTTQVLVLAPTREVAVQISQVFSAVGSSMPELRVATFIGGISLAEDKAKLRRCHVAVGTPGRITHLVDLKLLSLDNIRLFVLDEADQMLSGQFTDVVVQLAVALPLNKQMLALSATYTEEVAKVAENLMRSASHVRLGRECPSLLGVGQFVMLMPYHHRQHIIQETKYTQLLAILSTVTFNQCLVFSNSQLRAESICNKLRASGWPASHLTGGQKQRDRLAALEALCSYKCRVLVSTDLAARGLDSEHVNLVVNLDLPPHHATYLHRVGRAGRFGSKGAAITLATEGDEWQTMRAITTLANVKVKLLDEEWPSNLTQKGSSKAEEVEFLPEEEVAKWLKTNSTSYKQKSSKEDTNSTSQQHKSSPKHDSKTKNQKNKQDVKSSSSKQKRVEMNGSDNTSSEGKEKDSGDSGKENRKTNSHPVMIVSEPKYTANEVRDTAKTNSRKENNNTENKVHVLQEASSDTEKRPMPSNQNKKNKKKVLQEAAVLTEKSPTENQNNNSENEISQEAPTNAEKTPLVIEDNTDKELMEEAADKAETGSPQNKNNSIETVIFNKVPHTMRVNSVGSLIKRLNQKGGCAGAKLETLCGDGDIDDKVKKAAELNKRMTKQEDDHNKVVSLLQDLNFVSPSVTCSYADILSDIQEKYDKTLTTKDDTHIVKIPSIPNQLKPTEEDLEALENYCKTIHENVEQKRCEIEKAWAGTKLDISIALQMIIDGKDPATLLDKGTSDAAQVDQNAAVADSQGLSRPLDSPPEDEVSSEIPSNKPSDDTCSQARQENVKANVSNTDSTSNIKLRDQTSVRKKLNKSHLKHNNEESSSSREEPEQQQSVINYKFKETDSSRKTKTRSEREATKRKHKKKHSESEFLGDEAYGDSHKDLTPPCEFGPNNYDWYYHYYLQQQQQQQHHYQEPHYSSQNNNTQDDAVNDGYLGNHWTTDQPGFQGYQHPNYSHYTNYNQYSHHSHYTGYNHYPAAYDQNAYIESACKFAAMMEYVQTMGRVSAAVAQDFYSRKTHTDEKHAKHAL